MMDQRIRNFAWAAFAVSLTLILWLDVAPAIRKWGNAPANLQAAINAVPSQVVAQILPTVSDAVSAGDKRIGEALADANARLDQAISAADSRLGQGLATADTRLGEVTGTADKLRGDLNAELISLNSTVAATAAPVQSLTKDAQDSWDDLYDDVKGTVASATVAVTSVAQASEAVRDAAPAAVKGIVDIEKHVGGITADIHTATTDFVRPKTFWQKFKSWLETGGKIAARFL
jgi:hypothetical protein